MNLNSIPAFVPENSVGIFIVADGDKVYYVVRDFLDGGINEENEDHLFAMALAHGICSVGSQHPEFFLEASNAVTEDTDVAEAEPEVEGNVVDITSMLPKGNA